MRSIEPIKTNKRAIISAMTSLFIWISLYFGTLQYMTKNILSNIYYDKYTRGKNVWEDIFEMLCINHIQNMF